MEMDLAVPLSISQIEAANRLHQQLIQWQVTDSALHALKDRFPGFDIESSLLKVAAINQLYGTNIYAVVRMAQHVTEVMQKTSCKEDTDLVEELASLNDRKHLSFASKFAHCFIDIERFPIFDSFAKKMVVYHLGMQRRVRDTAHPYRGFVENIRLLKSYAHLSCTTKELDRYLWLAGLYREWCRNSASQINAEVARMLGSQSPKIEADLKALYEVPTMPDSAALVMK